MFHKTISRGMVLMVIVAMMNLTIGCNHHTAPTDSVQPTATETDKVSQTSAAEHSAINDFLQDGWRDAIVGTDEYIEPGDDPLIGALQMPRIEAIVDSFYTNGYRFSRTYSFAQSLYAVSDDGTDSVFVNRITVAFVYAADTTEKAAYVDVIDCEYGRVISPYLLSFVYPSGQQGWAGVTDGVWQFDYPAAVYPARAMSGRDGNAATLDAQIFKYLDCVRREAAWPCVGALIVCGATGPGYPKCVALGCAAGAIYAAVKCAFKVFG
ncbi:MAG: hypothetical protein RBT76_13660 [candidate division Zixibacteria bacterium]|jgi:hypothetical protein|nr:hypothetical protein [candidate division Zixibacteria bacterium]